MARKKKIENYDIVFAVNQARIFFSSVSDELDDLCKYRDPDVDTLDIPLVFFIATNLCFSAELFLKFVILIENKDPSPTHDLWSLFCTISPRNRRSIEIKFAEIVNNATHCKSKIISIRYEGKLNDNNASEKPARFEGLHQMLRQTRNAFTMYRYAGDHVGDRSTTKLDFHHFGLRCLCGAVDQIATETFRRFPNLGN